MVLNKHAMAVVPAFHSELGRLRMLGGDRALDLANTTHWREGRQVDFVPDFPSLVRWSEPARLLPFAQVEPLLGAARREPGAAAAVHREWAELRAAFRDLLAARTESAERRGHQNDNQGRFASLLNRTLAEIRMRGGADGLMDESGDNRLSAPLLSSALALAVFVALPPKGVLRMCEGDPCGGFFLDDSRSKPRRWCSMDTCGNRAKVRRFRARDAAAPPD